MVLEQMDGAVENDKGTYNLRCSYQHSVGGKDACEIINQHNETEIKTENEIN